MTKSRHDPFASYREAARKARLDHIENALRVLRDATFKNVTRLAISVAKLVAEAEAAAQPADGEVCGHKAAPLSHMTLLKNVHYRQVLHRYFEFASDKPVADAVDLDAYRALQLKCGALESQIKLLKQMLVNQDGKEGLEYNADPVGSSSGNEQAVEDAKYLLDFLDDFRDALEDMIEVVLPGDESGRAPGIHGPFDLIRTHAELEHLQSVRDRVEDGLRRNR